MEKRVTAKDIRRVFPENLRKLAASSPSIAQLCREIEINRTQFNRYLNGEAFPRPDVLQRICTHFNRDARILLEPLDEIDRKAREDAVYEIDPAPFLKKNRAFDHNRIPDGLYRYIAPAFNETGVVAFNVIRLFTLRGGGKAVYWPIPLGYMALTGQPADWQSRKQIGFCFQHADGFSIQVSTLYSSFFLGSFFSYGHQGLANLHTGYSSLTQARGPNSAQVQPAMLEKIENLADAIRFWRHPARIPMQDLEAAYLNYLESWTPN